MVCTLLRRFLNTAHLSIRDERAVGPAKHGSIPLRSAQNPGPIIGRYFLIGLAAQLFEGSKDGAQDHLDKRRSLVAHLDVLFHCREKTSQGDLQRIGARGKNCSGESPAVIRENIERGRAEELLGRNQDGGTHLRCAGRIDHETGNLARVLSSRHRKREEARQRCDDKGANQFRAQTALPPLGSCLGLSHRG